MAVDVATQRLILPEYDATWPSDVQQRWLDVARRIDVRGGEPTRLAGSADEVAQLERAIRAAGFIVRRRPPRRDTPRHTYDQEVDTVTTVIHEAGVTPPPKALGLDFGTSLRNLADALRAERERLLPERARIDRRLREIAAELAALDAAERVYRRKVDGAAVSRQPRALPAPMRTGPLAPATDAEERRRAQVREAAQRNRDRDRMSREERRHAVVEWLRQHGGELAINDLARQQGVFPTTFNQEVRAMVASGDLIKMAQGRYRRAA